MMARRGVLSSLAGAGAALLGGCKSGFQPAYRFRMIVEVETLEGVKTGSWVYEVSAWRTSDLVSGGKGSKWKLCGEALPVDMPNGQTLFALLKTTNPLRDDLALMSMAAMDPSFQYEKFESVGKIASEDGVLSPAVVAPDDYPMLATFADKSNPASVELVEPGSLVAHFGLGVRLRGITVELTDNQVTSGIAERLGWLEAVGRERGVRLFHPADRAC